MDLISIKRKYNNIQYTIIVSFVIVVLLIIIIVFKEFNKKSIDKKIFASDEIQFQQATNLGNTKTEVKPIFIKETKANLPILTDEGIKNMENIYNSTEKRVFLTYDDGPSANVTPVILDALKNEDIKVTFFVLGSRVELNPEMVKREYDEGHFVASHGYSHVYSQIYASPQSVIDEYNITLNSIRNAIGQPEYNPHLFRYPGGFWGGKYANVKKEAQVLLEQNGILHIDWNSLTSDAAGKTTPEQFMEEIDRTVGDKNSIVLLMHDAGNKMSTAETLPQIISYFRDRGYAFKNFYDIIK